MDKLIFKGKEYKLMEVPHPKFRIYGEGYGDIGFNYHSGIEASIPYYECFCLRIKDKYYGLKLIETAIDEQNSQTAI